MTVFDTAGRIEREIENYVDGSFSATEPITDRVTLYQFDSLSRVITTTLNYAPSLSGSDLNRVSLSAYDPTTARLLGQRDPLGRWSSRQYDALGRVTTTIQNCRDADRVPAVQYCAPFDAQWPDRNVTTQTRYNSLGQAHETVDVLGSITHIDYDRLGRSLATTRNAIAGGPTTADTNVITRQTYDPLGRVIAATDPTNAATQMEYDRLGNSVRVLDPLNRETRMGYDGQGTLRWTRRADGRLTVYEIDGLGRVVTTILAYQDGVVGYPESTSREVITRTIYDAAGQRVKTIDPGQTETAFTYDLANRLIGVTENQQSGTCVKAPCNVLTRYVYDRAGNRTAIVDARGNVRRFTYDAADRQHTTVDALGRTTIWWYDKLGRLTEQFDPRGIVLEYYYDGMDRLEKLYAPEFSGSIEFEYDALGRRTHAYAPDGNGPTDFLYDALGRIKQVTTMDSGTVAYDYDARGARTSLTYPDGTSVTYSYYADGRLKEAWRNGVSLAYYAYNPVGQVELVYANNFKHLLNYGHDWADRLTNIFTYGDMHNGIYQQLGHLEYTYNRAGQPTQVDEQFGLQTRQIGYTYDGLGRLSGANTLGGSNYSYAYDQAGNRTEVRLNGVVTEQHSYDAANQVSDAGWSYDANGNLLSDGTATYSYNALNQVDSVTTGGLTRHYSYNADGVLVSETTGGVETRYTQDLASPLSQVLQTTQGGTTTKYLYGLERLAAESNWVRTWYSEDALGSVRMTLNDFGTTIATASYDAWGKPEQGLIAPFGFTGELQDSTTGLVNLRARWYHTGHGTFTAYRWRSDESFDETPYSHHPYIYALSNPILYMDPDGRYARLGGQGDIDEVLEGLCPPGTSIDRKLYEKHGIINCIPKPPPPNNEQTSRRNGQERIEDILRESNQALNPPIAGPWPRGGSRTGGLADKLKACLLAGLLMVPLTAALPDVTQPDRADQGKRYVQADGITIKVGFDPRNAHKAVKLGYDENLRKPIPDGYSIDDSWFMSGLASLEDKQNGWWPELMDAMANTSRINFVVDGMDVFNNSDRLKADKITHREMDEIIRRGYIGKLHLWENGQEITGQQFFRWIDRWKQLRTLP